MLKKETRDWKWKGKTKKWTKRQQTNEGKRKENWSKQMNEETKWKKQGKLEKKRMKEGKQNGWKKANMKWKTKKWKAENK